MTRKIPFGRRMREAHFRFAPAHTPVNHGSFGAFPGVVQDAQDAVQRQLAERPDTFIGYGLPPLIDESRAAVAPLLGVPVDEVVFVPNTMTGVNTVLRNLKYEEGDVIVHFSTIYDACDKTIASIGELTPLRPVSIQLDYPIEDAEIVRRFRETVRKVREEGKNIRVAMFDTVLTFPGVRVPWEDLVASCKELGVLSLIDGAHGIGHIDLTHLGRVGPDFFISNCHKWLYVPRGCAVFHVPTRNQHLIRTSIPTSHGYQYPSERSKLAGKSPFVQLFEFVATIDYTPYTTIPAALEFREKVCGGEEAIRKYCWDIARTGGKRVAEILGTDVLGSATGTFSQCCFSNVRLPLSFEGANGALAQRRFTVGDVDKLRRWLNFTGVRDFDTYLQVGFHAGALWVRLSGQIYVTAQDFEWVGFRIKELCNRLNEDGLPCTLLMGLLIMMPMPHNRQLAVSEHHLAEVLCTNPR